MGYLRRLKELGAPYIDYSMAWKGALFLAVVVWLINLGHGPWAALPAALKQATYTFFVAGFVTRLCENIAVRVQNRPAALLLAVSIPSCVAIGLTAVVHMLKGTPEPMRSVLPTLISAPPAFFWWGWSKRRQYDVGAQAARIPPTETMGA